MTNLIFYELNEVPIKLFEFYAHKFPKSSFSYLLRRSKLYETHAADIGDLSPWISWPTLHRGVSNIAHGISDLGQNLTLVDREFPTLWQILSNSGINVGLFGSLQSYPLPLNTENYSFYVPDTFAAGDETLPISLGNFQKFNLSMTDANGRNVSSKIMLKDAIRFAMSSPFLGLTASTSANLIYQLFSEKFNPNRLVRRRSSQAEIAFDLYFSLLKSTKPNISFFFTNHLASSMHRYWPTIFPDDYSENNFDDKWISTWRDEIPHSVKIANLHIQRLIAYCNKTNTRLIIASSMGQGAVDGAKPILKQALIGDVSKLLTFCGIGKNQWEPRLTMAPRVVVRPLSEDFGLRLEKLKNVTVCGTKINVERLKTGDIRFDVFLFDYEKLEVQYNGIMLDPGDLGIKSVDLQDASGSNAYHIPEGILIDYNPKKTKLISNMNWEKISVLEIAPSVLRYFDVPLISHMEKNNSLFAD